MTTLQVGDKVQFRPDPLFAPRPDGFVAGTITELIQQGRMQFALIRRDDGSIDWIDVREVAPISTAAIVRAVRAMVTDEVDRENAIAGCRIADLVDDYDFAVGQAGNLSGAERDLHATP